MQSLSSVEYFLQTVVQTIGNFEDCHFELYVYESKGRVMLQTVTDRHPSPTSHQRLPPLLPSKNSPDLRQSQERPLAKVGWTVHPLATPLLEQVIYTRGAQANSAFRPSGVGKCVAISIYLVILRTETVSRCRRTFRGKGHSEAGWGTDGSEEWVQSTFVRAMGGR